MKRAGWLLAAVALLAAPREERRRAPAPPAVLPRPPSVADTDEDGAVGLAGGRLVVSPELRRLFDHHLVGAGEESTEAARARLEALLAARLPPQAAEEGRALLDAYLAMREAGKELEPGGDLEERWRRVRQLRRDFLGDEAARALFADDDADAELALARRRGLPAMTAAEAAALAPVATWQREAGLTPGEVHALRAETFGADGAARLAELDEARQRFAARLEDFRSRRAALSDPTEQRRLLDVLFSPPERLRVLALEELAGDPLE